MKNNRESYLNSKRDAWVEINLNAIEHNVCQFKKYLKNDSKLLAVVKADAYGCGACMIANTLLASGVSIFGVASIDEGMQLRQAKIDAPILILGACPTWAFEFAAKNDIMISIFEKEHLDALKMVYLKSNIKPKVHIKIDTGMNRIGVSCENSINFIKEVMNAEYLDLKGIFTHLACAENEEKTKKQINLFDSIVKNFDTKKLCIHFLNTAGILAYNQEADYNLARLGIGIYGGIPDLPQNRQTDINLKNVISLKGRIVNIHTAFKNQGVSYSHTFVANQNTKIATIPIGYADGVDRGLSNKIYGILNGKLVKQVGNITMDQMMFDVTNVENIHQGDIITLLGEDGDIKLNIQHWAKILNTIDYELMCRLKVRLSRVYTR